MFSQIMYGGAWRRNYIVLKTIRKLDKTDFVLLLETSKTKFVPKVNEVISELKELYEIRFVKLPSYLYKFTPLHYGYVQKLSGIIGDVAREENVDLIYVPHEVDWWLLAARAASNYK